jgi:hypothetical protein
VALPFDNVGNTQLVRGAFQFDTGALKQARAIVVQETRVMTNEFKKIGGSIQSAEKSVKGASGGIGSHLRNISRGLDDISRKWAVASAGAAAFAVQGLRSADSINALRIRFTGMLGSQEKAEKLMGEIGKRARELGQPMRAAQEAAAALLPQLNNNVDALKTYMALASRLSTLNQGEGLQGASFAIREAISSGGTDLVSLAERFNISKKQLREEIQKAKDSGLDETTAFATALDKVLNKMGVTEQVAAELAGGFSNQLRVAMEEVNLAAGEMFGPLLKDIVPVIQGFSTWLADLRQTNPELLRVAAAGTLIVAAISPLSFVLSRVISSFGLLKTAGTAAFGAIKTAATAGLGVLKDFKNNVALKDAGLGTKLGVGAAAIGAGVVLGGQVTKGLADAGVQGGDFDRIRKGEDPLAIAGERFKQVIVILVAALIEVGRGIAKAGAFLFNAFDQVLNAIKLGATYIKEGFLRITSAFGQVLIAIGQLLAQIPGQEQNGLLLAGLETVRRTTFDMTDLFLERDKLQKRLSEGFALPAETEASIDAAFDQLGGSVIGGLNDFFFPKADRAGEMIKQQLGRLGDDLVEGAESMFSDDMIDAWGEFQDELKKIEADAQKEREEELSKHEKDKTKLEADQLQKRTEALDDFNRKQAEGQTKLGWDILDLQADFEEKEKEAERKFRQEEKKSRREHRLNLLKAAAALDGRAIYLEQQRFKDQQKEREKDAKQQKGQRQRELDKRIADLQLQFQRETELQNANFYGVELPRLQAQQAEERTVFEAAHQERLAQITAQAAEQSAAAETAFIDTFNKILEQEGAHQDMMLQTQREGQAAMEAELKAWWENQAALIGTTAPKTNSNKNSTTSPGGSFYGSNNPYAPNTPVTPVTPFPNLPSSPNDQGFFPDLAGAASLAMTAANSVSTQSAAALNTMNGGSRGGAGLSIGTFAPQIVLGDIGKRSDKEVEELIDRGIMKTLKKVAKGGRS